jgi:hypothetical protein
MVGESFFEIGEHLMNIALAPVGHNQYENDYIFDLLGYRVLRGALSRDQVARINAWVDSQPPREPGAWAGNVHVHTYSGPDGTNYQNVVEGGEVFEELIDHPSWIEDVRRYICNDFNTLGIYENFLNVRGQSGFIGIHSGGHLACPINTFRHPTGAWQLGQINILMALTDIAEGDGATAIVPGSHKSHMPHPALVGGEQHAYRQDAPAGEKLLTQEVHLRAGDALMFTDALTHGSAARTSAGERRIIVYRYVPHIIRPRFNYLASEELLARLTPDRRAIIDPVPPRLAPGRTLIG